MGDVSWADSADKHGIDRDDVLWVMRHSVVAQPVPDRIGKGEVMVFLGYTPFRPVQWLEVIAKIDPEKKSVVIFHAMPMRAKWQPLLDEQQRKKI